MHSMTYCCIWCKFQERPSDLSNIAVDSIEENVLACVPNMPVLRGRGGNYLQDTIGEKRKDDCKKNHSGYHSLMDGIFTVYCQHGICVGLNTMHNDESSDLRYTLFRTKWNKAPSLIIYDNAAICRDSV